MSDFLAKNEESNPEKKVVPKKVFIVPYRNRVQHKFFFSKYMSFLLEDATDYEIYFSHQCDARTFNRGAVKNIGFLAIREKYPEHYKNITFIFNDVDTIPFNKIFDYDTVHGVVKHYYGYKYALGGIVVMKGADFERTNGFPCFWGWGMEDNVLQKRCHAVGLLIDRSTFYNIGSPEMLQLFDGISRIISKKDPWRGEHDTGIDGLRSMREVKYAIDDKSENPNDNVFTCPNPRIQFINIHTFLTYIPFGTEDYYNYDLREPKRRIIHPDKIKETRKTVASTSDWTNIPYYPTTREKRENVAKYLVSMGKQVPPELAQSIADDYRREVEGDAYNNFGGGGASDGDDNCDHNGAEKYDGVVRFAQRPISGIRMPVSQRQPQVTQRHPWSQVPQKYSPQYAAYIGARPRAQASARISLGGAY
jgi:hypothetical protein